MNPFWECHPLLLTEEKLLNIMLEALVGGKPLVVRPQHVPSDVELDVEDRKRQLDEYIEDEGEKEVIMGRMFKEFGMQWWDNEKVFEEMKKMKEETKDEKTKKGKKAVTENDGNNNDGQQSTSDQEMEDNDSGVQQSMGDQQAEGASESEISELTEISNLEMEDV